MSINKRNAVRRAVRWNSSFQNLRPNSRRCHVARTHVGVRWCAHRNWTYGLAMRGWLWPRLRRAIVGGPDGRMAVLLFAVPSSPLAQPWSIIGGNTISALVGIAVARLIHDPILATGVAVGLAIAAMSLMRCLHPPGGAAALTAVLGGPAVLSAGYLFAFVPVGLNCVVLVTLGWLFHKLSRHSYPHKFAAAVASPHGTSDIPPQLRMGFREEDIDGALEDLGETFDIDRHDLDRLLRRVELRTLERSHGQFVVADIMSRDVICVDEDADLPTARALLLDHEVRSLPVLDQSDLPRGSSRTTRAVTSRQTRSRFNV